MKVEILVDAGPEVLNLLDDYDIPYKITWAMTNRGVVVFDSEGMGWELFEYLADIVYIHTLLSGGYLGEMRIMREILGAIRDEALDRGHAQRGADQLAYELFRKYELMLTVPDFWTSLDYTLEY